MPRRALLLAGEHGRIGRRYIVSERFMSTQETDEIGCKAVGVAPPRLGIPIRRWAAQAMSAAGYLPCETVKSIHAPEYLAINITTPLHHSKAVKSCTGGRGLRRRRTQRP